SGLRGAHLGGRPRRCPETWDAGDGSPRSRRRARHPRAGGGAREGPRNDRSGAHRLGRRNMIPSGPDLAISGKDLRKVFERPTGETVTALDGVSLSVRHGGLTALVGPDGAGKTTLIRLFTALLEPDAGELTVLGLDARREAQAIQDRVGYMPQKFGL